jgi:hypothetical protein
VNGADVFGHYHGIIHSPPPSVKRAAGRLEAEVGLPHLWTGEEHVKGMPGQTIDGGVVSGLASRSPESVLSSREKVAHVHGGIGSSGVASGVATIAFMKSRRVIRPGRQYARIAFAK